MKLHYEIRLFLNTKIHQCISKQLIEYSSGKETQKTIYRQFTLTVKLYVPFISILDFSLKRICSFKFVA